MSEDSAVVRLGEHTIDFAKVGEKKIVEYLFHQYHSGLEDGKFLLNITGMDREEENRNSFIKLLKKFTDEIGDISIGKLITPLYISESKIDWDSSNKSGGKKANLNEVLDIKKVTNTFEDLQDDNIISSLSGMAEFSPRIQRLSGKSPITQNTMPKIEDYLDTIEDDLEKEIYGEVYEMIEIVSPLPLVERDELKVVLDLIEYKKQKLMKLGVSLLDWEGTPTENKTSMKVGFDNESRTGSREVAFSPQNNETSTMYGISEIIDNPSLYGEGEEEESRQTRIGTDKEIDIKRFFMNINSEIIGDITDASKIELTMKIKPVRDEAEYQIYTVNRKITRYKLRLTEASVLRGGESGSYVASSKYRIGNKYNTETEDDEGNIIEIETNDITPHINDGSLENKARKPLRLELNKLFNRIAGNYFKLKRRVNELYKEVKN